MDIVYLDGSKESFVQQGGEYRTNVDTILERIQYKKELIEITEMKPWAEKDVLTEKWAPKEADKWFKV